MQKGSLEQFNLIPVVCYDEKNLAGRVSARLRNIGIN